MTIRQRVSFLIAAPVMASLFLVAAGQRSIQIAPMDGVGPRPIETQTQSSIIRDYLGAWQSLNQSLSQNQAASLDAYFVGQAKQKLAATVAEQRSLGIRTTYRDTAHNIRVIFYSPEGLSIQLLDDAEYDVQVSIGERVLGTSHVRARYIAVLTPTESKWKVRVLQSGVS